MYKNKKILAVITARAGSSLPGKNYKRLNGLPLICHSITSAALSKYVDCIAISSNDENVYNSVKKFVDAQDNIIYINRPNHLATSSSKNESALIHAYYSVSHEYKLDADYIVLLQPTSPIRSEDLIDKCIEKIIDSGDADSLLTVNKTTPFVWKIKDNQATAYYDYKNRPMRQDIPEDEWLYHDNGNVYIVRKDILLDKMCRIGDNPTLYETTDLEGLQIDTELDFKIIESILKSQEESTQPEIQVQSQIQTPNEIKAQNPFRNKQKLEVKIPLQDGNVQSEKLSIPIKNNNDNE